MRQALKIGLALIAVGLSPVRGEAEQTDGIPFDTPAFLSTCSDLIPDVAMQVPMNMRCVSTARTLCSLSMGNTGEGACLSEVTLWLEEDSFRIRSEHPEAAESQNHFPGRPGLFPMLIEKPECSEMAIAIVPPEVICRYQDALIVWQKFRVVEISSRARVNK